MMPIVHHFSDLGCYAIECRKNGHIHNSGLCDTLEKACNEWNGKEPKEKDVRPVVRGKWKKIGKNSFIFVCSACDKTFPYKTSFCPNCGADMREEN